MCTFALTRAVGKRPLHHNIRERFRCIVFALYFFRMKLYQNVEKTTAIHLV